MHSRVAVPFTTLDCAQDLTGIIDEIAAFVGIDGRGTDANVSKGLDWTFRSDRRALMAETICQNTSPVRQMGRFV